MVKNIFSEIFENKSSNRPRGIRFLDLFFFDKVSGSFVVLILIDLLA